MATHNYFTSPHLKGLIIIDPQFKAFKSKRITSVRGFETPTTTLKIHFEVCRFSRPAAGFSCRQTFPLSLRFISLQIKAAQQRRQRRAQTKQDVFAVLFCPLLASQAHCSDSNKRWSEDLQSFIEKRQKKIVNKDTVTSCIYLTDYWVMWEVLLCTVSTVTLSEIRLLKKKQQKKSLLFDITPYNNSIYKRFHLLHKSSRTKQQITNYTRQRTNKYLYISRVVCLYQKKNLYKTFLKKRHQ